jgi:hypothetical protein
MRVVDHPIDLSYLLVKDSIIENVAPDPSAAPERELAVQAAG